MWVFWIPIIYLMVGLPFGIHEARSLLHDKLKDEGRGWYAGDGSGRRTEEERIRELAAETFWPGIGAMLLWPITAAAIGVGWVWSLCAEAIASNEIKAARQRAIDRKTKEILEQHLKAEQDKFKDL